MMQTYFGKGIKVLSITTYRLHHCHKQCPGMWAIANAQECGQCQCLAIPGSWCVHTAPPKYQSSLCSQTATDHPVTPEFAPKPPPVLAWLKNQGELLCKVHRVFIGGIILFYNHSVGGFSMFFLVWLFFFFPYTDVFEVCLKPNQWTLLVTLGFSCNTRHFWCVYYTENPKTMCPVGRNTQQSKSQKVLLQNRAELTGGQGFRWSKATPENSRCRNLLCLYYVGKAVFSRRVNQMFLKKNKAVGCQLNETWWLQGDLCKQCLLPWAAQWLVNLPVCCRFPWKGSLLVGVAVFCWACLVLTIFNRKSHCSCLFPAPIPGFCPVIPTSKTYLEVRHPSVSMQLFRFSYTISTI